MTIASAPLAGLRTSGRSRTVRLGDILQLRKDVVHPRDKPSGGATFVGLEHIEPHTGRRSGSVSLELSALTGRKPRFYKGDIVYGYLRPYLNKVWVAEFDGLCSVDQYVYTVRPDLASADYVAWFMRSPQYLRRAPISTTPGQLPRIRTEEVASVKIELPPLEEQRRFATRVDEQIGAVERARAAAGIQLELTQALIESYLRESVSRGTRRMRLAECLCEVTTGVGAAWRNYRVVGATRARKLSTPVRQMLRGIIGWGCPPEG